MFLGAKSLLYNCGEPISIVQAKSYIFSLNFFRNYVTAIKHQLIMVAIVVCNFTSFMNRKHCHNWIYMHSKINVSCLFLGAKSLSDNHGEPISIVGVKSYSPLKKISKLQLIYDGCQCCIEFHLFFEQNIAIIENKHYKINISCLFLGAKSLWDNCGEPISIVQAKSYIFSLKIYRNYVTAIKHQLIMAAIVVCNFTSFMNRKHCHNWIYAFQNKYFMLVFRWQKFVGQPWRAN